MDGVPLVSLEGFHFVVVVVWLEEKEGGCMSKLHLLRDHTLVPKVLKGE